MTEVKVAPIESFVHDTLSGARPVTHFEIHWRDGSRGHAAWQRANSDGVLEPTRFSSRFMAELSIECFFVEQSVAMEYKMITEKECHKPSDFVIVEKE